MSIDEGIDVNEKFSSTYIWERTFLEANLLQNWSVKKIEIAVTTLDALSVSAKFPDHYLL